MSSKQSGVLWKVLMCGMKNLSANLAKAISPMAPITEWARTPSLVRRMVYEWLRLSRDEQVTWSSADWTAAWNSVGDRDTLIGFTVSRFVHSAGNRRCEASYICGLLGDLLGSR